MDAVAEVEANCPVGGVDRQFQMPQKVQLFLRLEVARSPGFEAPSEALLVCAPLVVAVLLMLAAPWSVAALLLGAGPTGTEHLEFTVRALGYAAGMPREFTSETMPMCSKWPSISHRA